MNNNEKNESTREAQLRIALLVGQPDNGKSFIANLLVDFGKLTRKSAVLLGDGEEGSNLVFTKSAPRQIKPLKLESEHDVEAVITEMEEGNKTHCLLDTAGSSQRPIRRACGDFKNITASEVDVLPIIVVGSRGGADRVAIDWLRIVQNLPKIYWIWNNQRYGETDGRTLPADLETAIPGISSKIVQIRIPPLRDDISTEITLYGVAPSRVAAGSVRESVLLKHRAVRGAVGRWIVEAETALRPLLNEFPADLSDDNSDTDTEFPSPIASEFPA